MEYNPKKNTFYFLILIACSLVLILTIGALVPHEPSIIQNYFASEAAGETIDCSIVISENITQICVDASNTAETVSAIFKVITSVLGVFANPFVGFLSDLFGRRIVLMLMFIIPGLTPISLLLYIYFPVISAYPFTIFMALILLVDANVIINSFIVDITTDESQIHKKMSLMAMVTFASSTLGPFISFLNIDIICYVLFGYVAFVMILTLWLPSDKSMGKSTLSVYMQDKKPKENLYQIIKKYFSVDHYKYTILGLSYFFHSFGTGILMTCVNYFLIVSVGFNDTDRAISTILMSVGIVLAIGILFPWCKKHMSLPMIIIIFGCISAPSAILKAVATSNYMIYAIYLLLDPFGMVVTMCISIYVAETCSKEHQGAIQGYLISFRVLGTGLGTLFGATLYTPLQNLGGFWKLFPFVLTSLLAVLGVITSVVFYQITKKTDTPLSEPLLPSVEKEKTNILIATSEIIIASQDNNPTQVSTDDISIIETATETATETTTETTIETTTQSKQ